MFSDGLAETYDVPRTRSDDVTPPSSDDVTAHLQAIPADYDVPKNRDSLSTIAEEDQYPELSSVVNNSKAGLLIAASSAGGPDHQLSNKIMPGGVTTTEISSPFLFVLMQRKAFAFRQKPLRMTLMSKVAIKG